jgi:transposase
MEPILREEWELNTPMRRLGLRTKPGVKPTWKWNKIQGKLERSEGKGIDWWRYYREVCIPKLWPFAEQIGGTIVEDGAPSHMHHYVQREYKIRKVAKLIWPGNSPDLNAIESVWPDLKRKTTAKGPPGTREKAEKVWTQEWEQYPQEKLQRFVDRIRAHIPKIIACGGGNEYEEGLGTREWARRRKAAERAAALEEQEQRELAEGLVTLWVR